MCHRRYASQFKIIFFLFFLRSFQFFVPFFVAFKQNLIEFNFCGCCCCKIRFTSNFKILSTNKKHTYNFVINLEY